jgi:hypothetical protein
MRCRHTNNITVYSGKDRKHVTPSMTNTNAHITTFTARPKNVGTNYTWTTHFQIYLMIFILK